MTRSLKPRKPKGLVIEELNALVASGQELAARPAADLFGLAELSIEKLAWTQAVTQALPQMSRGIQAMADFSRAALKTPPTGAPEEQLAQFRASLSAQVAVLAKAVERWARSGTRPL